MRCSLIKITPAIALATAGKCGSSSFGRAIAFQAIGGEFEPRLPLFSVQSRQLAVRGQHSKNDGSFKGAADCTMMTAD